MTFVTYRRVSTVRDSAFGLDANIVNARFQFDVFAATYSSMVEARDQVRLALQRWSDPSDPAVDGSFIDGEGIERFEGGDPIIHHGSIDVRILYRE